jgi:hypothetical protein
VQESLEVCSKVRFSEETNKQEENRHKIVPSVLLRTNLTTRSRVLLQNIIFPKLSRNSSHFMEPGGSLPYSQ